MEKINTDYKARLNPTCRPLYENCKRLNLVDWFKGKNFSNKLSPNQLESVHHNQGKKRNNFSLTLQANLLPFEAPDCEQSLFCSKIFREESRGTQHTRVVGPERASAISRKLPALLAASLLATRMPHLFCVLPHGFSSKRETACLELRRLH